MRRREFITLFGSAAAWPLAARAQQRTMPVIGFLNSTSPEPWAHFLAAFHHGLEDTGFFDGRNVTIEYRWAKGHYDRLRELAADLVGSNVSVIAATGGSPSALAAKMATRTIPVVFTTGGDPVRLGLVESLNRPGGNVTGVMLLTTALSAKRLGLLRVLLPSAHSVAMLVNPSSALAQIQQDELRQATREVNLDLHILLATNEREIGAAFEAASQLGIQALLMGSDPFFSSSRDKIIELAARHRVPALYEEREFPVAGG